MTTEPTVPSDPHEGMSYVADPCLTEVDAPGSVFPHQCTFGEGHYDPHHCQCGHEWTR